ncbi:MAG: NHLP bacteriocin export ABC transporter permease/ATPase subunit [Candidatus Latescibacteria bacterium]|nr:NHLP bacteriocin export ABC transporter permease/ATPase subunit [Candidatus Latescibacterota bacterium]
MSPNPPNRLAALAVSLGETISSAGNRPIHLDDPQIAYFVERGTLDVFLTEREDDRTTSSFKHVLRAGPGRLVFGVGEDARETSLITVGKGLPGCQLRRVQLTSLLQDGADDALASQVDAWLAAFAAAVVADIELHPHPNLLISPGEQVDAEAGCVLMARADVTWIAAEGNAAFLGTEEPEANDTGLMPLTPESWLTLSKPTSATGLSSQNLLDEGRLVPALAEFHRMALKAEQLNRLLLVADEANLQVSRADHRRRDEKRAREGLFSILSSSESLAEKQASTLLATLEVIGKYEGIAFKSPSHRRDGEAEPSMRDILTASGVRARRVTLSLEDRWWRRGNSGALLGFQEDDGRPVALLPRIAGGYRIVDLVSGESKRVNADRASNLIQDTWSFYRPLSNDQPVGAKDLLLYATKNLTGDLARFVITGCLAGILMLLPAVLIGVLVDWVLPMKASGMLVQLTVGLVALAVVGTLLSMLQGTALMRLEGRISARLSSGLWDRLLGLQSNFFKDFTAGDLAVRMSVFQVLRDQVSGMVGGAILSVIFLGPAFVIIFAYDSTLGWLSLGIGLVSLVVTVGFGLLQIAPQHRRFAASRQIAGDLFQFINGIGKLRSSGAEGSAFAFWARKYRAQQQAAMEIGKLSEHVVAFSAAVPILTGTALFVFALYTGPELAVGDFLVVYAMSMTFYAAVTRLGQSFEAIAAISPGVGQVQPVLSAVPEPVPSGDAVVKLSGEIQFDRVRFQYAEDGPLILNDVSLHARPGEFIAIIGETGSGKSTLLRLALGLQEPSVGAVYYDGRDLANLNKRVVRHQVGVVMQDGSLRPGNIGENIIGLSNDLTVNDAWRAARQAAVAEDIRAMPMGMFTAVGDSSATFSGGQAQRIMIAAALVRNPRILFLDEATSWLDAESQREVMESIESLAVTRIVIAHRLSTIRKANRIYVLHDGRIVQQGGFNELFESAGLFRDLMRRQMA